MANLTGRALYANNARTQLSAGITTSDTTITLVDAGVLPQPTNGDYFYATLADTVTGNTLEVVKVTARSGNSLTVVRAQQGTAAAAYLSGDLLIVRTTREGFAELPRVPASSTSTTLVKADSTKCVMAISNLTVPASVFETGDIVSIYNRGSTNITLLAGSGIDLFKAGNPTAGNVVLTGRALATVWFATPTEAVVAGQGLG